MNLEMKKAASYKLENISLALALNLQTHGWKAALLESTKATKFLQVITAVFVYRYLFKRARLASYAFI